MGNAKQHRRLEQEPEKNPLLRHVRAHQGGGHYWDPSERTFATGLMGLRGEGGQGLHIHYEGNSSISGIRAWLQSQEVIAESATVEEVQDAGRDAKDQGYFVRVKGAILW